MALPAGLAAGSEMSEGTSVTSRPRECACVRPAPVQINGSARAHSSADGFLAIVSGG